MKTLLKTLLKIVYTFVIGFIAFFIFEEMESIFPAVMITAFLLFLTAAPVYENMFGLAVAGISLAVFFLGVAIYPSIYGVIHLGFYMLIAPILLIILIIVGLDKGKIMVFSKSIANMVTIKSDVVRLQKITFIAYLIEVFVCLVSYSILDDFKATDVAYTVIQGFLVVTATIYCFSIKTQDELHLILYYRSIVDEPNSDKDFVTNIRSDIKWLTFIRKRDSKPGIVDFFFAANFRSYDVYIDQSDLDNHLRETDFINYLSFFVPQVDATEYSENEMFGYPEFLDRYIWYVPDVSSIPQVLKKMQGHIPAGCTVLHKQICDFLEYLRQSNCREKKVFFCIAEDRILYSDKFNLLSDYKVTGKNGGFKVFEL